ncbi:MAG: hypothetical protein AAF750_09570 [Planctomycetota bacterium]
MIRPSLLLAIVISATLQGLVLFWPVLFSQPQEPQADTPTDTAADAPVVVAIADTPTPEPEPVEQPEEPAQQPEAVEPPAPQPTETEPQPEAPAPKPELAEAPVPSSPEPTPEPEPIAPPPTEPTAVPEPEPTPKTFASNEPAPGPNPEPKPEAQPVTEPTTPVTEPTPTPPTPPAHSEPTTTNPTTREGAQTPPSDSERETGVVFNFRAADMPRLRELRGVMVLVIDDQSRVLDEVDLSDGTPRRKGRLPRDLLGPLARGLENHTTLEYASDQRNTRQRLGLAPNEKLFVALPNRLASEISHAYALKAEQMRRQGQTLGLAACQLEIRGSRVVPVIIPLD